LQASGVQKVQLVEGHDVYLTKYQLQTVQEQKTQRKEIGRLLDVFFSKVILGESCALGKRKYTTNKRSLPTDVTAAIHGMFLA
jgi:hypothetical protein